VKKLDPDKVITMGALYEKFKKHGGRRR